MDGKRLDHKNTYHIRIKGVLKPSLVNWLENITVTPQEHGETLLVGRFADQAALRGLLDQLWNLNFTLVSVERIEPQGETGLQQK